MAGDIDFQGILNSISDEHARKGFRLILNLTEELVADNRALREEVQRLRDENNRLKGEQGKPQFKPAKPNITVERSSNHSSEEERKKRKTGRKGSKLNRIAIDRKEHLEVDRTLLPEDSIFKGCEKVVVQNLEVKTANVLFLKEKWYSPSTKKTYLAELPRGYDGGFGPDLKTHALFLYYGCNMSQPKTLEFLQNAGILISAGTLSGILTGEALPVGEVLPVSEVLPLSLQTQPLQPFHHQEYEAIFRAGLSSSLWHGADHTPTTVNGKMQQCQVVGNSLFSIYATTPKRNRLSILDVLSNQHRLDTERCYLLNEQAHQYLKPFRLSNVIRRTLLEMPQDEPIGEAKFIALVRERLPQLNEQQYDHILDAAAISAYYAGVYSRGQHSEQGGEPAWPIVDLLLCDDAPAFKGITRLLQLCWVHEGRHYKKLFPFVPPHRELLEEFRKEFWTFYKELLKYQEHPTPQQSECLSQEFDDIFSKSTGYKDLDKRIEMTRAKKDALLTVLEYPEVPLHNNDCELAARNRVRKRDVSFGPRSREGIWAWDSFMSLYITARKLGVNFYHYLYDRVSKTYAMPSLASLIEQRGREHIRSDNLAAHVYLAAA